jgi:hypothetical protein
MHKMVHLDNSLQSEVACMLAWILRASMNVQSTNCVVDDCMTACSLCVYLHNLASTSKALSLNI